MGHVVSAGIYETLETRHNKGNVFILYTFDSYKTERVLRNLYTNRFSHKKH
jgi:hypothetical protein